MLAKNHLPAPTFKGANPVVPFDRVCANDSSYANLFWLKGAACSAPSSQPQTLIDANGTRTELLYDQRGRLTQSTVKSRAGDAVTHFTLDDEGLITAITLPNGVQLFNDYDNADRLTELRDADGNKINYSYDAHGNRTEVKRSDGTGELLQQQQWLYDDLGRVMQAIGGAGQTTSVSYNVNSLPTNTLDGNNSEWKQGYDALERLVNAYDPTLQQVQYGYDKRDNLTKVTDQRGLQTTYTYNDLDQVTSISSPDTGTQTLHYDNAGNLSDSTDAKGQRVDYSYDVLNRLQAVEYANAANLNITYTYDQNTLDAGTPDEAFNAGIGRLTQISDASGTTQYRYDDKGNIHTRINQRGTVNLGSTYQYDDANNLTGMAYPGGIQVNYQRNHLAQVTGITLEHNNQSTTLASNIQYQGMGPVTSITWGNGMSQLYTYDQSGRIGGYALSDGNKNITFAYDGNNNITQQIDIANQLNNFGYDYDELNRLIEENGYQYSALPGSQTPYNQSFTYDGVNNRLSKTSQNTTQTYQYSDTSNRLQGVDNESYQFDANGNTLVRGSQSWQYNAQNRMASYSEGGVQQATYTYNGQGERVIKQLNGETIHYLYNAAGQLQGEYHYSNGNLTLRQSYVWLGMLPVAMLKEDIAGQTEQLVYIHSDHLNSPRMITDQNQNTVWQWHSSAFGEELPQENGLVFNLRFPGQYYDVESGINYNYYRDYDPNTGSYLQSDPIGLAGGLNTYGYVSGNPVGNIDPYGLYDASLPQGFVDFSAGLGDALLLGFGDDLRDFSGIDGGVNECSGSYQAGGWTSFAFGGGRLVYAGVVKGYSIIASSGVAASAFRSGIKTAFRGGAGKNWRPPNLSKYADDNALRLAAGRTNPGVNAYGAGVSVAGFINGSGCGCEK